MESNPSSLQKVAYRLNQGRLEGDSARLRGRRPAPMPPLALLEGVRSLRLRYRDIAGSGATAGIRPCRTSCRGRWTWWLIWKERGSCARSSSSERALEAPHSRGERGAALLAVLLLVAVMGALAAAALERLRLSTSLAINSAALDQARSFAIGVESLLTLAVDDLIAVSPERTTLAGGWNGSTRRIPLPDGGLAEATIRDGGNCFNINSVVEGTPPALLTPRAVGATQFAALMTMLQVPEANARQIADAAGDWVDADVNRSKEGAEDPEYAGAEQGYRTANTFFAEVSELRPLSGMTPEIYERVRRGCARFQPRTCRRSTSTR
jgi:hypothetical protein